MVRTAILDFFGPVCLPEFHLEFLSCVPHNKGKAILVYGCEEKKKWNRNSWFFCHIWILKLELLARTLRLKKKKNLKCCHSFSCLSHR